jgi:outer membrane protein assembly factor BamD (BamD/ComL family)
MRHLLWAALGTLLLGTGCGTHDDIAARYSLERKLWRAQVHERKINIAFLRASQQGLYHAILAFNDLLSYDPLTEPGASGWDRNVVLDIRRIQIASKIALANLYFLSEQYHSAGEFYKRTLDDPTMGFSTRLDMRLNLARSLFMAGETDSLRAHCAGLFGQVVDSDEFWSGDVPLKDIFMQVPIFLVRYYREKGDDENYRRFGDLAEQFYERITTTWPGSPIAARASSAMVNLYLVEEEWRRAIREIDRVTRQNPDYEGLETMILLKGEILAFALDRKSEGTAVFEDIVREYPGTMVADVAQYDLAVLALRGEDTSAGERMLKDLETKDTADPEIKAKAMLTRARHLESTGRWDLALPILRRMLQLHPYTSSAVEAPLLATQHYVARDEPELAETSLERATEFYLSLISRRSNYGGNRLLIEDFLIENYLVAGRAADVATLLEEESEEWDEASTAGGLFRAALIYTEILDDPEQAVRTLKKCIELFPETRYAKVARAQLDALSDG